MPSFVFTTDESAAEAFKDLKFAGKNKNRVPAQLPKDDLIGYSKISTLLCNTALFRESFDKVSAELWAEYCRFGPKDRNKFSRALSVLAMKAGFSLQSHRSGSAHPTEIVLVGGKDPDFLDFVRNKLFWKDSMNGRHGEFSHALQWLTLAEAKIVPNLPELYSKTVDYATKNHKNEDVTLWSWLVDCFPSDMQGASEVLRDGPWTLGSDSFRAPQFLMDYLLKGYAANKLQKNFVATYLFNRYKQRHWLSIETKYDEEGKEKKEIRLGGDTAEHGRRKHSDTAQWKPVFNAPNGPVQGYRREGTYTATNPKDKDVALPVTFHGVQGTLYFNNIE